MDYNLELQVFLLTLNIINVIINNSKVGDIVNKRFLFILTISLVSLVALIGGIFIFSKDNSLSFDKEGYILDTSTTRSERYYFNAETKYSENVNDKYEFTDVSNGKVTVEKNNFVHYLDGSMSFLKNGVILDLASVGENIVPYYNITNKSTLEYANKSYFIKTADKVLTLNNFIGRISENKYIVAGKDLTLKLATNEQKLTADYYEIIFVEDGIVKIENQEVSYQMVSDGTYISVGDNVTINLGNKKIYYDSDEKLSLDEMTIDGDENIEIIPDEKYKDPNSTQQNSTNNDNNASNDGTGNGDNQNENSNNQSNTGDGSGSGSGGSVTSSTPTVSLVDAKVNANKIDMTVQVVDVSNLIKGELVVNITNTTTGKRVYSKVIETVDGFADISVETLAPDNNYLLSIVEQTGSGDNQYFQKLFRTDSLGLSMDKTYAATDELAYTVYIDPESDVSSVQVSLYNENMEKIAGHYVVTAAEATSGKEVEFINLTKNTSYTAMINNVVYNNVEYVDKYMLSSSNKTLKEKPSVENLKVSVNDDNTIFNLSIGKVNDPDKSISKFTYKIYKADDITLENINTLDPVSTYETKDSTSMKLSIDGEKIVMKEDYRYRVVVEYFDNEKYGEYVTELSDNFIVTDKPHINFELDKDNTTFNRIVGTITIVDENCTVPIAGRDCSSVADYINGFKIEYLMTNSSNQVDTINDVHFDPSSLEYKLDLTGLTANSNYEFRVYGDVDLRDGYGIRENYLLGTIKVSTPEIDSLTITSWKQNESTRNEPINVNAKISSLTNNDNLILGVNSVTFNLYKGKLLDTTNATPIKTIVSSGNIKNKYYDNIFTITSSGMFGIDLDTLRSLSDGRLNKYYTIEITNATDSSNINNVPIENNLYTIEMPPILLVEDEVEDPTIIVNPVQNVNSATKDNSLDNSTVVGYDVVANFAASDLYNYFAEEDIQSITFYAYDSQNREVGKKVLTLPSDNYSAYFSMRNGTPYAIDDYESCDKSNPNDYSCLVRGNSYKFGYNISINTGGKVQLYPANMVMSSNIESQKQAPALKMYISSSNENSVTYKYQFADVDNSLYASNDGKNYFYYKINNLMKSGIPITLDDSYETALSKYTKFSIDSSNKSTADKSVTFSGLTNGASYQINIQRALKKTGDSKDIETAEIGSYTFDGYYDPADYELTYKLSYNANDNRLKVFIINNPVNDVLLNRVVAYELKMTPTSGDTYTKVYTNLNTCSDENGASYKCIILDYKDIEAYKGKDTTISITGYYDNGYVGFEKVSNIGYIFQGNGTSGGVGPYLFVTTIGAISITNKPRSVFKYQFINSTTLKVENQIIDTPKDKTKLNLYNTWGTENYKYLKNLVYTQSGIYSSDSEIYLNPKTLDKTAFSTTDNYFRFDSITPKISTSTEPTINGGIMSISSSSITDTILSEEFVPEDGQYYFYVDFYKNAGDTEAYRQEKVNYNDLASFEIKNFTPNTTYYYKVNAYMYKGGVSTYTQLFDGDCATCTANYVNVTYSFKTKDASKIFYNNLISYTSSTETVDETTTYSKRNLNITTRLVDIRNYFLKYEIYDGENVIYTSNVTEIEDNVDIKKAFTSYDITGDTFVFGDGRYNLKIYAVTNVLDENKEIVAYDYVIYDSAMSIAELSAPTFAVTKGASVEYGETDNNYVLTFEISPIDNSKVIKNGKYRVELIDSENNVIDSRNGLDATLLKNKLVFEGLNPDTEYRLLIYADIYMNNLSLINKEQEEAVDAGTYTNSTIKEQYLMFTTGASGVSLGSMVVDAFEDNVVVSFVGGANIEKITSVKYTIRQGSNIIKTGTYAMGTDKNFLYTATDDYYKLIINPTGLKFQEDIVYNVNLNFYVGEESVLGGRSSSYPIIYVKG